MQTGGGAPVVLLLQGPRSPFFGALADALVARGAAVRRVLFCPGDALFWPGRRAIRHRTGTRGWAEAFARICAAEGVSDVVGLGDGRPLHAAAFAVARTIGVRVHVVEQGYLRPGWLTLEPDAMGSWRPGHGPVPPGPLAPRFRTSFAAQSAMDVAWHLANLLAGRVLYPGYRSHERIPAMVEWLGWAGKAMQAPARARARRVAIARVEAAAGPLFLFPLQLETDFQVRRHGPAGGVRAALATVLASFARHAPAGARLIVKPHPLDPGLTPWARLAAGPRTIWLDGGGVEALFARLSGVVTINSTVGLSALQAGLPVATLGRAIYDPLAMPGPLDAFWADPVPPDPARVHDFCARMAAEIQCPGSFDGDGVAVGAAGVAELILARARRENRSASSAHISPD